MAPRRRLQRPAIFVCDIQEKFRSAIWEFDKIVLTTQKLLRAAKILNIPVYVTTQNGARLGATVPEVQSLLGNVATIDKTYFSMWVPEIQQHFDSSTPSEVVIVGIESHVCVTQTALDLLEAGHKVYVIADGVSSCNQQEVPVALARLRAEGVTVTTSESFIFECMGDAAIPEFREVSKLIKETSGDTKTALGGVLSKI
ncbi:isochorismatase [Microdochium bolleyi]|uniref:Isochorismatase n=1 Tax=Microdochium bolleyi TaxID=196109 RepID=A0A136JC40_9PEZI|nr:isochorismatase [Microdochium bolleyi]